MFYGTSPVLRLYGYAIHTIFTSQIQTMSYQQRRSNRYLRTSMDIGMGVFYIVIGCLVIFMKAFGTMAIPPIIAYILGGMMLIGGGARLYRGIKDILPQKPGTEPTEPEQ